PIVEIDSSYYGIPSVENAQRWVERTSDNFVFNIKTYRLFTRHQTPIVSLSREIQESLVPRSKKNIYDHEMPVELTLELWRKFRAALSVVRLHGRNHGTWNLEGLKASSQRFDYDYNGDELTEIAREVK